jgi:hypothetical protein
MTDTTVDALIVDLLIWLEIRERTYQEVMDAWRTSCPRLTVWEDANDRKLVATEQVNGREVVRITLAGSEFLQQRRTLRKNSCKPETSRRA